MESEENYQWHASWIQQRQHNVHEITHALNSFSPESCIRNVVRANTRAIKRNVIAQK